MNKRMGGIPGSCSPAVAIAAKCFDVALSVACSPLYAAAVSAQLPTGCNLIRPAEADHRFVLEAQTPDETLFSVRHESSANKAPAPQTLDSALKTLQKQLHVCIAEHAKSYIFVHAGVVVWKNHTIVFPGFSHAGKSTLVWNLVQAGAVYYSDEYAVFDEQGCVHPFALPIALRLDGGGRQTIMPDNVDSSWRKPDFLAFARYRPGAIWRPRSLQPAAAMMQLIRHSISIRANPAVVIPVLKHVSLHSQSFAGARGESKQLLHWLESCVR
jgi:hypothetical protein